MIVVNGCFDQDHLEQHRLVGETICFTDDPGSVFVRRVDGEVEELWTSDHADYVEVGQVNRVQQHEDDVDESGEDFLAGWLGRIGNTYFLRLADGDGWEYVGRAESDRAAAALVDPFYDVELVR